MNALAAVAIVLLSVLPAQTKAPDLTGKWQAALTRTAPDGRTQTIEFTFDLVQKGKVLTGTVKPDAARTWTIEKDGAVAGNKVTFWVQQPNGPKRTFNLTLVKDRLQGEMLAEMDGQSFTAKVDAGRAKDK